MLKSTNMLLCQLYTYDYYIMETESQRPSPSLQYLVLSSNLKVLSLNRLAFHYGKNHSMAL